MSIIGVWRRGSFSVATADTVLTDSSMLILAGTSEQLAGYEDAIARTEAARPPLRRRLADLLGADAFLSPDFDKMVAGVTGGVQKTKPGERVSEGGTTIYENPRAPIRAGAGTWILDPMTGDRIAETPYAPQTLGQGGALVDRGKPSAPGAAVLHVKPETFAPSSGGAAGGGKPKALPLSLIEDEVRSEMGLQNLSGMLWDGANGRPASPEQSARFTARVRERWAQENRGAEPSAPAATPPPVAGAAPAPASSAPVVPAQPLRPATEQDAQAAMQEAGGDAKRAGEILRARGLSF